MESFDPSTFSGVVPLFPLPNVVHFPKTVLPLHVFEPRYRSMTKDALEGEKLIGMALLKPGWEKDYYGNPPVHEVVGVGKIIQETRLPDGRFNISLYGLSRARVLEVVGERPYRTARVELLRESEPPADLDEAKRKELAEVVRKMGGRLLVGPGQFAAGLPLGCVLDNLASVLEVEPAFKQELLEELDVAARCDRLLAYLAGALRPRRPGPSEPSLN